jgi:hypothetical protein
MNGEPLSWKIKTLRRQLIDLGSAIRRDLRCVDDDVAHGRAIEKCLMAGKRLNFAEKRIAST